MVRLNDGERLNDSLVGNDFVAKEHSKCQATSGDPSLDLAGGVDILWKIRDKDGSQHAFVRIDSEPFMVVLFEKVPKNQISIVSRL